MSSPVLLVAGGSRGIGAAAASLAGERGYDVAVNYNTNSNAAAKVVKAGKGPAARLWRCKATWRSKLISNAYSMQRRRNSGHSPILCIVRHHRHSSRLDDVERKNASAMCSTSIRSARCCACAPACAACRRKHGGKGGAVVMLSSMAATLGGGGECVWYAATKGAIDSMVIGASREVAKEGIRINAISPGMIDTDIQPPGRIERLATHAADGQGGQRRRSGRRRSCFCSRTPPPTSTAPTCAFPARARARHLLRLRPSLGCL